MFNLNFYLDGVSAKSKGISLQGPIQFSGIEPIVETIHVPGRNGDLIFDTGAYKNRVGEASCFALKSHVQTAIDSATDFLLGKSGYRRLECSDDPEHFWFARVANGARIENRLNLLNPFEIKFDCMPQHFEKSGERTMRFDSDGTLYNKFGTDSLPLIIISGNGSGTVTVGNETVQIKSIIGKLIIDCSTQNAYNSNKDNANHDINLADFPKLHPGENAIAFTGNITSVEIIPRWWSK